MKGCKHIINVPYEVGTTAYETLWHYRHPWELSVGGSDPYTEKYTDLSEYRNVGGMEKFRSELMHDGMHVVITDGWIPDWDKALYKRIASCLKS